MNSEKTVRTRVAPSPTGYPHVGTAFQSLFNWVYAHKYHGQFVLRIEDTDRKRYVEGAEEAIVEALDWLGISPDEGPQAEGEYGPYRQSERLELYQKYAQQLIDEDKAYYCFCSADRLAEMREQQQQAGKPPKYDQTCRQLTKEEVQKKLDAGEKGVVRMKVPDDQEIIVHDALRKEVKFSSDIIDDQVILKSDGFPTYHLAVVVDDNLMKITHMLRGEEWLSSAPKHVLLYQYLGWEEPVMIHTPILRNPDRSKLSKRKGNTSLWWYKEQGYLPEALLNFLALLVWTHPEEKEIFTKEEMLESFEWEQLTLTGPIFDTVKLQWLNGVYIREKSIEAVMEEVKSWALWVIQKGEEKQEEAKQLLEWIEADEEFFKNALSLTHERLKLLSEVPSLLSFYYQKNLEYDRKDLLQKHETHDIIAILTEIKKRLASLETWDHDHWDKTIRSCADEFEFKHKDLFMTMRSAITACKATPPLFDVMNVLGKEESFRRIETAVAFLSI